MNNPNAAQNLEFFKPGHDPRRNLKGRPRKLVASVIKELEARGIKPASNQQIRDIFMQFVNMTQAELEELGKDESQPIINIIVIKEMLSGKGFEVLKDLIERAHGRANQPIDVSNDEKLNITIYNASREFDLNEDGSVTPKLITE